MGMGQTPEQAQESNLPTQAGIQFVDPKQESNLSTPSNSDFGRAVGAKLISPALQRWVRK